MGQFLGKQTPSVVIEQARAVKVDPLVLATLRDNIWQAGNAMTLLPSKGGILPDRHAYSGDLSKESIFAIHQIRPLLSFEYKAMHHAAVVRHGLTGEVLMMMVREPSDDEWFAEQRSVCSIGGDNEARLYSNGQPIAVDITDKFADVIPPVEEETSYSTDEIGASMSELVKVKEKDDRLLLKKRKEDGTPGKDVASFTRVRNRMTVFRVMDPDAIDAIAALAIAWYNSIDFH